MAKNLTLGVAVAIFLGLGVWNVLSTGPGSAEPGSVVQARLAKVPLGIGNWKGEDLPVDEKHMKVSHAEAFLSRSYSDHANGDTVNLMILYGNPGDLGAHDPKVCYGVSGFEMAGPAAKRDFENDDRFWAARFEKPSPNPASFELLWAWSTGIGWQASDSPRLDFADKGRIYKLYVQQPLRDATGTATRTPGLDRFLPPFLEALRTALTAPTATIGTP